MVHHSASEDDDGVDALDFERWHRARGWRDIGYHWVVELVGETYHALQGRPMSMTGAHCPGWNSRAVGVCFAGNFMAVPPPAKQLDEGAQLIAGLCQLGGLSPRAILRHRDHRETLCPGDKFPLEELLELVSDYLGGPGS